MAFNQFAVGKYVKDGPIMRGMIAVVVLLSFIFPYKSGAASFSMIGDSTNLVFDGVVDSGGLTTVAGLTASADVELIAGAGSAAWTFQVTLNNTSMGPNVTSSRLSGFGFNVSPDHNSVTLNELMSDFDVSASGNVPNGLGNREICFKTGGGTGNCAGGSGGGISLGGSAQTFTFVLNFLAPQNGVDLTDFFVRYQSLDLVSPSLSGGSGTGTVVPLPLPALLFLSALCSLLGVRRISGP
jgi:hypothetical protein